ncbi:MAG: hypothetical protein Q8M16_04235 [Pirellulaceae bacterium]|nr:hypothetical protein [Pirellulaceae bacterium]
MIKIADNFVIERLLRLTKSRQRVQVYSIPRVSANTKPTVFFFLQHHY